MEALWFLLCMIVIVIVLFKVLMMRLKYLGYDTSNLRIGKSWEEKLVESYFRYHTQCEPGHCPVMDAYYELTE